MFKNGGRGFLFEKYFNFVKSLMYEGSYEWQIAFRKISQKGMLFEGNLSEFAILKNSLRYWYADPFLFKYKGKEYIFAEMYDRKKKKGVIGVAKMKSKNRLNFKKCLEVPYHLSYPCVYEKNGTIYMIPECYQSRRIEIYKCKSFPYKWIVDQTIINEIAVDTTPCELNGKTVYFSTFFESVDMRINDNLFLIDAQKAKKLKTDNLCSRSAGHIFTYGNKLIRPSQDCRHGYGKGLVFSQIDALSEEVFGDSKICCFAVPNDNYDVNAKSVKIKPKGNHKYEGIHTYNFSDKYEVIDLKYSDGRNIYAFMRNLKIYLQYKIHERKH